MKMFNIPSCQHNSPGPCVIFVTEKLHFKKSNFVWTNFTALKESHVLTVFSEGSSGDSFCKDGWGPTQKRSCSSQSSDFRELSSSLRANLLLESIVLNPPKEDVTTEERTIFFMYIQVTYMGQTGRVDKIKPQGLITFWIFFQVRYLFGV